MSSAARRSSSPHPSAPDAIVLGFPWLAAHRRLAARVINQAVRDLESRSSVDRESAREFLAGSPMLHFWCQLAQIDAGHVITRSTVL
jgi:hypothetical protein